MKTDTQTCTRRRLLQQALGLGSALALPSLSHANGVREPIVLLQTTALSGPLAELGQELLSGAKAYFGSAQGRAVRLVTMDDGYDVQRSVANAERLLAQHKGLAFFGTFGTPNNEAIYPLARQANLPILFPLSGARSIRDPNWSGIYNLRASYADEVEKIVLHNQTVGNPDMAVAYQDNSFGADVFAAAQRALTGSGTKLLAQERVRNDSSNVQQAVKEMLQHKPKALLLGLAGKPAIDVIRAVRQQQPEVKLYGLSVLGNASNLAALGGVGKGVIISQIVPSPWTSRLPVVLEYQKAMHEAGSKEWSHLSLEGYLNAKTTMEAIRRCGGQVSTQALTAELDKMTKLDLGGFQVNLGKGAGSKFVDLLLVDSRGRLMG